MEESGRKSREMYLVNYSDEQKGYKCYNSRTKHARVSRDVVFDGSPSCYLSSEDDDNEAEMPHDERETVTLEESPDSFRLSGLSERLSQFDQSDEESTSSANSAVNSLRRKPRRRFTCKEKGKKKMSEYGTDRNESNRHESDSKKKNDGRSRAKSVLARKASTLANEQLRRSTHQKNPVVCFVYNEYMAHHYVYMTHVAEVCELESYAEATTNANSRAAME